MEYSLELSLSEELAVDFNLPIIVYIILALYLLFFVSILGSFVEYKVKEYKKHKEYDRQIKEATQEG